MGKMTSALKPVQDRYNKLQSDDRYNFRRQIRSYIKWYGYISQVCRMFDAEMQKEYAFCSYLLNLLPKESVQMFDLEGALRLEFYKLEDTFKGAIALQDESVAYEPASGKGKAVPEQKEPLEEVIQKINELFGGEFSEEPVARNADIATHMTADFVMQARFDFFCECFVWHLLDVFWRKHKINDTFVNGLHDNIWRVIFHNFAQFFMYEDIFIWFCFDENYVFRNSFRLHSAHTDFDSERFSFVACRNDASIWCQTICDCDWAIA